MTKRWFAVRESGPMTFKAHYALMPEPLYKSRCGAATVFKLMMGSGVTFWWDFATIYMRGVKSSGACAGELDKVVSDKRLVEITLAGDPEAFGQLVERYKGAVYALVCHYTGRYGEVEDLAQESFVEAYRSLKRLKEHAKFCAWLRGITYRVCMNWLRKEEKRHQRTVFRRDGDGADDISYKAIISADVSVDRELARREVREAVLEAIASLPEKYQLPVVLRYLQELSYEEIGSFMDLPKSTIRGILYRANKILREELHDTWVRGEIGWPHVSE